MSSLRSGYIKTNFTIMTPRLFEKYKAEVAPLLQEQFTYKSKMQTPRITKVVINVGIGRLVKDSKLVEKIESDIEKIAGQKPVLTKSKKSIAGFKLREGLEIGVVVTLRRKRMYDFLDRLISVALPRSRDFQGIPLSAVDQNGNLNIGIREQTIFPEVSYESLKEIFGFQVTVVTTAKTKEEGFKLFQALGVPLKK